MTTYLPVAVMSAMSLSLFLASDGGVKQPTSPPSIYDFKVKSIDGKDISLSQYKGDVVMIVNVASR